MSKASVRPGWQVDLKWVFGLLCLASTLIAAGLFSVRSLTAHDTATGLFTGALGGFASGQISDEEYAAIQAAAAQAPEAEYTLPGLTQPVKGSDIASMLKDEAVKLAASGIAEVNYAQGPDAAEQRVGLTAEDGGKFSLGPLTVLTKANHDALRPFFTTAVALALLFAAAAVFFSRGPGRIGSAGLVLALVTGPFAFLWSTASDKAAGVSTDDGVFAGTLGDALAGPASDLADTFTRLFITGAVLTGVAIASHVATPLVRRGARAWAARRQAAADSTRAVADAAPDAADAEAAPDIAVGSTQTA